MIRAVATTLALLWLLTAPAVAVLAPADLDGVVLSPPPDAALPLDAEVTDEAGQTTTLKTALSAHPVSLFLFVDYTCTSICGPALAMASSSLQNPALADLDVGLVVVGIDPKDGPREARVMRDAQINPSSKLARRASFLTADEATVARLTEAVGYRYRYDPDTDQFAHPAGTLLVNDHGTLLRVVASLALDPDNLRLTLVDAGKGRVGTLLDQVVLRCYGFDPATGLYNSQVWLLLRIGGGLIVVLLAGLMIALSRSSARRRSEA
ncbi:SCO family protein [Consotaella salsifontis]|uniref:Protein SCO1/2 n=1 Tax=Consotaella salsifontis TaxID=1365950 RepID=A0A1T4PNH1_9HYPH|nr:SCO family protein [Consotaella salsifontis]SJZ93082.1 protein SCO1/2 [Consotaella salsifontis]